MAEPIFLSLWLRDFTEHSMLRQWAAAIGEFPQSSFLPGIQSLAIYPLDRNEAPILENSFDGSVTADELVALAAEFLHPDYSYEARLYWDVWGPEEGSSAPSALDQWKREPQPVTVACIGPQFAPEDDTSRGHLQLDLGRDWLFLPPDDRQSRETARQGAASSCYRDNMAQLIQYIQRLQVKLPLTGRQLWVASGEDFGQRVREAWGLPAS